MDNNQNDDIKKRGFLYWFGIVVVTLVIGVFILAGLVFGACFLML
jgi:hypothetical protein